MQLSKMKSCPFWQPWLISLKRPRYEGRDVRLIAFVKGANKGGDKNYPEVVVIARGKRLKFAVRQGTEIDCLTTSLAALGGCS
jgi:hypothetical protein